MAIKKDTSVRSQKAAIEALARDLYYREMEYRRASGEDVSQWPMFTEAPLQTRVDKRAIAEAILKRQIVAPADSESTQTTIAGLKHLLGVQRMTGLRGVTPISNLIGRIGETL